MPSTAISSGLAVRNPGTSHPRSVPKYARQVPTYALLRQWCGEDAAGRFDELAALRAEALRSGQIAERAISALEEAGLSKIAASLKRELGVPIGTLRASQKTGR